MRPTVTISLLMICMAAYAPQVGTPPRLAAAEKTRADYNARLKFLRHGRFEARHPVFVGDHGRHVRLPGNISALPERVGLRGWCSLWGDEQIFSIQRKHIVALQDKLTDKPATADRTVTILRILMDFAVEREYRDDNPAKTIKKLHKSSDVEGHMPWPDAEIEKFLAVHGGTTMGLSVML